MHAAPFRNILAPVDFSDLSALALRYAAAIAQCAGTRPVLLYANTFSPPPYFTGSNLDELERQFRASFAEAEQGLRRFAVTALGAAGEALETQVVEGAPADAILDYAARRSSDLLVLGTHGRTGVNRWMLGSVAERVLRASPVPVLTVRQGSSAPGDIAIRHILCPVNDSPAARQALATATGLAACFGARVTVVHVMEEGAAGTIPDLCSWVAENQRGSCDVREVVRHGDAAAEIVAAAGADCDLAVIGARHRALFDSTVLGTTTVRVVRHARCPVLTVAAHPPVTGPAVSHLRK